MCCFSGPVAVEGTRIFGRVDRRGWQALIYEMTYRSSAPVAMVLPLPVVQDGDPAERLRFVDFSGYPSFFAEVATSFEFTRARAKGPAPAGRSIPVQKVGAFEASFLPGMADFANLDPRFRIDTSVWRSLKQYRTYGFAVFQLGGGGGAVHPMAFAFRTSDPTRTFFPTLHVHDGSMHMSAHFDHALYTQTEARSREWELGGKSAGDVVDVDKAQRLVRRAMPFQRLTIHGTHPNTDLWVEARA
jgi:hypothetical protein